VSSGYVVVDCPRCRRVYVKLARYRYVTCPYCGARARLGLLRVFQTREEAVAESERIRRQAQMSAPPRRRRPRRAA